MEELAAILLQACCELVAAGGVDLFTAFAGWKSHQVKVDARQRGTELETKFWSILFKAILPVAILLTMVMIFALIARSRQS